MGSRSFRRFDVVIRDLKRFLWSFSGFLEESLRRTGASLSNLEFCSSSRSWEAPAVLEELLVIHVEVPLVLGQFLLVLEEIPGALNNIQLSLMRLRGPYEGSSDP